MASKQGAWEEVQELDFILHPLALEDGPDKQAKAKKPPPGTSAFWDGPPSAAGSSRSSGSASLPLLSSLPSSATGMAAAAAAEGKARRRRGWLWGGKKSKEPSDVSCIPADGPSSSGLEPASTSSNSGLAGGPPNRIVWGKKGRKQGPAGGAGGGGPEVRDATPLDATSFSPSDPAPEAQGSSSSSSSIGSNQKQTKLARQSGARAASGRTKRGGGLPEGLGKGLGQAVALVAGVGKAMAGSPVGFVMRVVGGPTRAVLGFATAAGLCAFLPGWPSLALGAGAIASVARLKGKPLLPWRPAQLLLSPLHPLGRHMALFAAMWAVMPWLTPGMWRGVCYWQRLLPILAKYLRVHRKVKSLKAKGQVEEADALWQEQHEWGAEQVFQCMCDLKGFYLKLGQILATKTDMLPPTYTSSLSRLLDRLPAYSFDKVQRTVEKELGGPLAHFFAHMDPFPLASATIAQVHTAKLAGPGLGRAHGAHVAVKVQHAGVRRMMRADLANLKAAVDMAALAHIDLGFDLRSLVHEYHHAVPLECDFGREAAAMESIASRLAVAAEQWPLLRKVVIPEVVPHLSTTRLLTMSLIEGVPLLDLAHADQASPRGRAGGRSPAPSSLGLAGAAVGGAAVRSELMAALVASYGVQILAGGLFHTDPHPGNLLAVCQGGEVRVALLDFGQIKELSRAERVRAALLVAALAARDGPLLRATLSELGVRIERCDDYFCEVAGYILFDTRMDLPETRQSPLDPNAHVGWRTTRVPALPRDLFMMMRVITLLRGVLSSMGVFDVSAALLWRPLALEVLSELTHPPGTLPPPGLEGAEEEGAQGDRGAAPPARRPSFISTANAALASPPSTPRDRATGSRPNTPSRAPRQQQQPLAHGLEQGGAGNWAAGGHAGAPGAEAAGVPGYLEGLASVRAPRPRSISPSPLAPGPSMLQVGSGRSGAPAMYQEAAVVGGRLSPRAAARDRGPAPPQQPEILTSSSGPPTALAASAAAAAQAGAWPRPQLPTTAAAFPHVNGAINATAPATPVAGTPAASRPLSQAGLPSPPPSPLLYGIAGRGAPAPEDLALSLQPLAVAEPVGLHGAGTSTGPGATGRVSSPRARPRPQATLAFAAPSPLPGAGTGGADTGAGAAGSFEPGLSEAVGDSLTFQPPLGLSLPPGALSNVPPGSVLVQPMWPPGAPPPQEPLVFTEVSIVLEGGPLVVDMP